MNQKSQPPGHFAFAEGRPLTGLGANTRAEAQAMIAREAEDEYGENGRHARAILAEQCPAEM